MYPLLLIFLALAIYTQYFEAVMVSEDGFFQWITFFTLLFSSLMSFYRANILKPFRGKPFSLYLIILGFIFLIFALDEVSWFQRVLGFNSPLFFQKYNTNKQFNFHHLIIYGININNLVFTLSVKFLATLYFLVLPFFYNKINKVKNVINRFAIALPRYTHTGAYLVLTVMVALIPSDQRTVIFEFGFYWILVLMMYNPLNDEVFSRISLVR
jgi:hypothetical protein